MKPHIKCIGKRVKMRMWLCSGGDIERQGTSPIQAYRRWLNASIKSLVHAPAPLALSPDPSNSAAAPCLPPRQYPEPQRENVPVNYPTSVVQQVHGTAPTRAYSANSNPLMRIALQRSMSQPKLASMSGGGNR